MPIINTAYLMQSECKICWMGRNLPRQDLINSQLCNRCNHDQFHDHCNFHYHTWIHTEEMLNRGRLDENLYCQDFILQQLYWVIFIIRENFYMAKISFAPSEG